MAKEIINNYISVKEAADKWGLSERSVRNYCASGRIAGAIRSSNTWKIPESSPRPARKPRDSSAGADSLIGRLRYEKDHNISGGIYHQIQIDFAYNSNHIEGSRLSSEQTRFIFETCSIGPADESVNVDDIVEAVNHFSCVDFLIDNYNKRLSEKMIMEFHRILKSGTSDSRKSWFKVGGYKLVGNVSGVTEFSEPEDVPHLMKELLSWYTGLSEVTFIDILEFHHRFEMIHPFQDGNGRVGRLIMFKECLKHGFTPFIIKDPDKMFYYRGLSEWKRDRAFLEGTCMNAQGQMEALLQSVTHL